MKIFPEEYRFGHIPRYHGKFEGDLRDLVFGFAVVYCILVVAAVALITWNIFKNLPDLQRAECA
jgi:hypothetical protein